MRRKTFPVGMEQGAHSHIILSLNIEHLIKISASTHKIPPLHK